MEITFKGNGIVWNPKANKRLCRFENGTYTTTDQKEIEILSKLGYESDMKLEEPAKKVTAEKKVVSHERKKNDSASGTRSKNNKSGT